MLETENRDAAYRRAHVRSITGATTRSYSDADIDARLENGDDIAVASWGGAAPAAGTNALEMLIEVSDYEAAISMLYAVDGGPERIAEIRRTISRITKIQQGTADTGGISSYETGPATEDYRQGSFI